MKRKITPVKVEKGLGALGGIEKSHPAFGMLGFNRMSGVGGERLFGSEVNSMSTIRMIVCRGREHWNLHEKKFFGDGTPLVEVEMTSAQFAEAITTMNVGSGVPCTIRWFDGPTPDFRDEKTTHEMTREDLEADVAGVIKLIDAAIRDADEVLAETSLGRAKKERVQKALAKIKQELGDNMPFLLAQYQRALHKATSQAKAEVDGFVTHVAMERGLEALRAVTLQTALPAGSSTTQPTHEKEAQGGAQKP